MSDTLTNPVENPSMVPANLKGIANHTAYQHDVDSIINKYTIIASGSALVPVPYLDLLVMAGIQLKMLQSLGKLYNYKFADSQAKSIIAVLMSTLPAGAVVRTASILFRVVPFVGPLLSGVTGYLYAAASTYAIGKVFNMHFASGLSMLSFDPKKMQASFKEYYDEYVGNNSSISNA